MDLSRSQIFSAVTVSAAYLGLLAYRKVSPSGRRARPESRAVRISIVDSYSSWDRSKDALLKSVRASKVMAVDFQWRVCPAELPAIVSVSVATSKQEVTVLRLFEFTQIPEDIEEIFRDASILKLGIGVVECAAALKEQSGIEFEGCIDIRYLAMKTSALKKQLIRGRSDLSLDSLMETVLGKRPAAMQDKRSFDWTTGELTGEQNTHLAERAVGALELTQQICAMNGVIPRIASVLRTELWLEHYISHEFSMFTDINFELERFTRLPLPVKPPAYILPPFRCVVCRAEEGLITVSIVPEEYHDAFPKPLNDTVLVCYACHVKVRCSADILRRELEGLYDAPIIDPERPYVEDEHLKTLRRAGILLREQGYSLPEDLRHEYEAILMSHFFTTSLDDEILHLAASHDYRQPLVDLKYHANIVCENIPPQELGMFENMWREHFVMQMKPKALPKAFLPRGSLK